MLSVIVHNIVNIIRYHINKRKTSEKRKNTIVFIVIKLSFDYV